MPGCEEIIDESQGFLGLPIRRDYNVSYPNYAAIGHHKYNTITTYWRIDRDALEVLSQSKTLIIHLLGSQPPIIVDVKDRFIV